MSRRYSYSYANASRFILVYDQLIDIYCSPTTTDRVVQLDTSFLHGTSVVTLQNRVVDGLKWLAENFYDIPKDSKPQPRYTEADYKMLKLNLKAHVDNHRHLILSLKISQTTGQVVKSMPGGTLSTQPLTGTDEATFVETGRVGSSPITEMASRFRAEVQDFLEDRTQKVRMFTDLVLSDADQKWVTFLESTPGLIVLFEPKKLTIVKE